MRKTITTLVLTAALATLASPALALGEECTTTTEKVTVLIREASPAIPAVPPVYLTVTEYEFIHRNADLNGGVRWETDPNWNAESNPNSFGWAATGNTRQTVTDTVLKPGTPAVPAQEAVYEVREIPVRTCKPVVEPTDPPLDPVPAPDPSDQPVYQPGPAATPAPEVIHEEDPRWDCATMGNKICGPATPAAPAAPAVPAAPVASAPVQPQDQGQLANTGAASWVLPAGLAALTLGAGATFAVRRRTN